MGSLWYLQRGVCCDPLPSWSELWKCNGAQSLLWGLENLYLKILNLITASESLSPCKVTDSGNWDGTFFRGTLFRWPRTYSYRGTCYCWKRSAQKEQAWHLCYSLVLLCSCWKYDKTVCSQHDLMKILEHKSWLSLRENFCGFTTQDPYPLSVWPDCLGPSPALPLTGYVTLRNLLILSIS